MIEAIKFALLKGWSLSKVRDGAIQSIPVKQKMVCMKRPKRKKGTKKEKVEVIEEEIYEPDKIADLSKVPMGVELLVSFIPPVFLILLTGCVYTL